MTLEPGADVFAELSPPYSTIVADPPWPYDAGPLAFQRESGKASFLPYSTMTLAELAALPVGSLGCVDAHLFLWTTHSFLYDTPPLAEAWGFRVRQTLVWCKAPMGGLAGGAFTPATEFVLVCRRKFGDAITDAREAAGLTVGEVQRAIRGNSTGLAAMWEQSIRYPNPEDWDALRSLLGADLPTCGNLIGGVDRNWWEWKRGAHSAKPAAFLDMVDAVSPGPRVELFSRTPRLGWDSWGHGFEIGAAS